MSSILDQRDVREAQVYGRTFTVTRIEWKDSPGLSYDVTDAETGFAIHDESFDDEPGAGAIKNTIDELIRILEDDDWGTSSFFDPTEVRAFVDSLDRPQWTCKGCGHRIATSDADMVTDHVRDCDAVDGAGNPTLPYTQITGRRPADS